MTRINSFRAFAVLGMSAALLAAPSAFAREPFQPAGTAVSAKFRYEPSDAPDENYRVLRRVVKNLCLTNGPRPMALRSREQACVRETLDDAVAELGRENIKDVHLAATGRRAAETELASARR